MASTTQLPILRDSVSKRRLLKFHIPEIPTIEVDPRKLRRVFNSRDQELIMRYHYLKSHMKGHKFISPMIVTTVPRVLPVASGWPFRIELVFDPIRRERNVKVSNLIKKVLMVSLAEIEDLARTSIDIATFPLAFTTPMKVEPFERLRAFLLIVVTAIGKLKEVKGSASDGGLGKSPALRAIYETVHEIRELAQTLLETCEKFQRLIRHHYDKWTMLTHRTIKVHYFGSVEAIFRIYGDMTREPPPEDVTSFEGRANFHRQRLHLTWSPSSFHINSTQDFVELPFGDQMDLLQEVAQFAKILLEESVDVMEAAVDRWKRDMSSPPIKYSYAEIKHEIETMLPKHKRSSKAYVEVKLYFEVLTRTKMDLLQATYTLTNVTRDLLGRVKAVEKYVRQAYTGRLPGYSVHLPYCCLNRRMKTEELVLRLAGSATWSLETFLPLTPKLANLARLHFGPKIICENTALDDDDDDDDDEEEEEEDEKPVGDM